MSEFVLAKPGKKYTGVQPRGMKTLIFEDGKRLSCHWQDFNELFIPLSVREQQIREELRQIKQELFNELDFSVSWTGEQVDEEPLTEDKIAINDAFDKVFAVVAAILGIEGEQTKMNRTEYKVGDVVKLKDRDGDLVKGFIYWDSDYTKHERYAIAVVNQYTIDVSKISLLSDIGGFELVGLWVEGEDSK